MVSRNETDRTIRRKDKQYTAVPWNYFDRVYCISLRSREDRRQEARAAFETVGLTKRVEFVIVDVHPTNREQGIYESHMLCMQKGIHADAQTILIFEDDIIFDRFSCETLENSIAFLRETPGWHVLFLGCMVKQSNRTSCPSVLKVRYGCLAHAYAVNRNFAEKLIRAPWRRVAYDDFLRDLADDAMYAVWPSFAFQSNSRSDNFRYLTLDRFRRICGGLRRLQKVNEFYQVNKQVFIYVHLLLLIVMIALVLFMR